MTTIPTRFSEHRFRLFEPLLMQLMRVWPAAIESMPPSHLRADSYANQIRDAAKSFLLHRWTSDLPYDDFRLRWAECSVQVQDHGRVKIGRRGASLATNESAPDSARPSSTGLICHRNDPYSVNLILQLHHLGIATEPSHLVSLASLTALQAVIDEKGYDVLCSVHPQGGLLVF